MQVSKVSIVDNLHAKIYLADNFVLAGSANPSTNGLGFEGPDTAGLIESCVASNDITIVDSWTRFFEENIKPKSRSISDDDLIRAKLLYSKLKSSQNDRRKKIGDSIPGLSACDWTTTLDVVNCAQHASDVIKNGAYMCPPKGGASQHRRSRYFGLYRNNKVELIAQIDAVVDIENSFESATVQTKNINASNSTVIERVISTLQNVAQKGSLQRRKRRVFLLGKTFPTSFEKDDQGGLFSSKVYFDVAAIGAKNAKELAVGLKNVKWSEVPRAPAQKPV
jgi:hypothetical protein